MKLFLFVLDLVGFAVRCTLAVLVALLSSLMNAICLQLLKLIATMRKMSIPLKVQVAEKNGTRWYRVQVGTYSFMLGRKVSNEN